MGGGGGVIILRWILVASHFHIVISFSPTLEQTQNGNYLMNLSCNVHRSLQRMLWYYFKIKTVHIYLFIWRGYNFFLLISASEVSVGVALICVIGE